MNKHKLGLSAILIGLFLSAILVVVIATPRDVKANFEGYAAKCLTGSDGKTSDDGQSDTGADSGTGGGGDWTQKGTPAYTAAKAIFDNLTQKMGFSGAGAAGALAVAKRESMFDPKAINPGGGVAGFFQWSGFSNSVNGDRITLEGSIKAGDTSTLTTENEIKLMDFELNGMFSKTKACVGPKTDPTEAALAWTQDYEGVAISDPQTKAPQLVEDAKTAYTAFGGSKIPANSALLGSTSAADAGQAANDVMNNAPGSGSSICAPAAAADNNILSVAKSLLGYFTYGQVHGVSNIGSVDSPKKSGVTDCSGFVWLVLAKAGYSVPDNMGWYTLSMEQDAKGPHKYLKEISESEVQAGDVVIVNQGNGAGDNGHTAIIEGKWIGDKTRVIQEGGAGGGGGVNEATFIDSFSSLLVGNHTVTYARAVKKSN